MQWTNILPGVWQFRDSCNVYAVQGTTGMVLIDAGTGAWLEQIDQLPAKPVALLLTHYFRDHAAGAVKAAAAGIDIYAPQYEADILADPQEHIRQRETYIIYDNLWNLNVPIESTPLAGAMLDYETRELAGMQIEAVPLPGATFSQTGYAITLPDATEPIYFVGEAIHSHGRLARVAPLQYNYNNMPGAVNVVYSANDLIKRGATKLLPSLGEPILKDATDALSALIESMHKLLENRPGVRDDAKSTVEPDLIKVTDHVYMSPLSNARAWFLISESGKVMAIDYGYRWSGSQRPDYPYPANRRALLHGIDGLKKLGYDKIDVVLVSHFHDDHVAGIPLLQRLYDTECWAADTFADLLASPEAHCFPCNWPQPIRIDKRIPVDETVTWEEYTFHFGEMSGHTRFAALLGFEADGKTFAHTGDQYFFLPNNDAKGKDKGSSVWETSLVMQNHVYRNGYRMGGFKQSADWLLKHRPDIILTGHTSALNTDDHYFKLIEEHTAYLQSIHKGAMQLDEEAAHFDVDSWGGWIWPYRTHLAKPMPATVTVTVRNPLPRKATLAVSLVGPTGWQGSSATMTAGPRAEVSCQLQITPAGECRRQLFAVELTADGQPFGQIAEAQMTVGGERF